MGNIKAPIFGFRSRIRDLCEALVMIEEQGSFQKDLKCLRRGQVWEFPKIGDPNIVP